MNKELERVFNSFDKTEKWLIEKITKNMWLAWLHYEWKVKSKTPVDEWVLESSIITWDVNNDWTYVSVDVWTNLEYAPYIEFWVKWRNINYSRWDTFLSSWNSWAWMFRNTLKIEKNNIVKIIKW